MGCHNIAKINLGLLPDRTFPQDDNRTYIYKRNNGHVYVYYNHTEHLIGDDDGLIISIPIINDETFEHLPDPNHIYLFIKDNKLLGYNHEGTIIDVITIKNVSWNISEW